jgi:hypothetical protein
MSAPQIQVAGTFNIMTGSTFKSHTSTDTVEYRLIASVGDLDIDSGGSIDAEGTGYQPKTGNPFRSYGNLDVLSFLGNTSTAAGGSHGGRGGYWPGHQTNSTYGNFAEPVDLGSSGGYGASAGKGGGAIKLMITNTLTVDGTITANGTNGASNTGGGAGGSVWITTNTLAGDGIITANGGSTANNQYGSGGGGRIAVYYQSTANGFTYPNTYGNVQAFGGSAGVTARNGAAGTVFLKNVNTQSYGDLIINNGNTDTVNATTLPVSTATTSGVLQTSTLSASNSFTNQYFASNQMLGFYVNPNTSQNGTATVTDDTIFPITSNTVSALYVTGDMTSVAASGNTFRLVLKLDNLEICQGGKLDFAGGQIYVLEGDLSSNNSTDFVLRGAVTAHTIDLTNGVTWTNGVGAASTVTVTCASNMGC